jgi:hypothetical protein
MSAHISFLPLSSLLSPLPAAALFHALILPSIFAGTKQGRQGMAHGGGTSSRRQGRAVEGKVGVSHRIAPRSTPWVVHELELRHSCPATGRGRERERVL